MNESAPRPAPATTIVHGPGVLSEQPVIEHTPEATITVPPPPMRRLFESVVVFISAILFLRTIAVEPFGVPTGSMAPTLIGNHKNVECPRCGFHVRVGEPSGQQGYPTVFCTNCGKADLATTQATTVSGDRLLVDKNVFRIRSPRRWEPAVFICPSDRSKPYVKRVVGLPGESLQVFDGDIYVAGKLVRKTLKEARECRVLVFDSAFAPTGGWNRRWYEDGTIPVMGALAGVTPPPWLAFDGDELRLSSEKSTAPNLVTYWHVSPDTLAPEVLRDGFEYNGHTSAAQNYAVHDFTVEYEVTIVAGQGTLFTRMTDGQDEATAHLAVGGDHIESGLHIPAKGLVRTANRTPLQVGKTYRVEMAFVDRRIGVAVDGKEYFSFDFAEPAARPDLSAPFKLGAQGITATVKNVKLYRDIYYRPSGTHGTSQPYTLGPKEYFLLGDNSANSDDSRSWQIPAVPERNFLGKPFLLHQPSRSTVWNLGRRVDSQGIDWSRIRWLR